MSVLAIRRTVVNGKDSSKIIASVSYCSIKRAQWVFLFSGMMCPPLPEPVNAIYIKTPKKVNKIAQRSGGALSTDGLIQTRWGSQFKKCPLGVEIPKSKVMCTLKCHDGLIVKGANVSIYDIILYD